MLLERECQTITIYLILTPNIAYHSAAQIAFLEKDLLVRYYSIIDTLSPYVQCFYCCWLYFRCAHTKPVQATPRCTKCNSPPIK